MEGNKKVRSMVLVWFVLATMLIGQSKAQFSVCFVGCFGICVIRPPHNPLNCAVKCFKTCFLPPPLELQANPQNYFCKLGCAVNSCANISTIDNPHVEEVQACVDSCSGICAPIIASPPQNMVVPELYGIP